NRAPRLALPMDSGPRLWGSALTFCASSAGVSPSRGWGRGATTRVGSVSGVCEARGVGRGLLLEAATTLLFAPSTAGTGLQARAASGTSAPSIHPARRIPSKLARHWAGCPREFGTASAPPTQAALHLKKQQFRVITSQSRNRLK